MRVNWVVWLTAAICAGADWPQFRGVAGMGLSEDKGLPVEFGPEKNVLWKTPLPPGHSSPILVGRQIFLTAYEGEKLLTISLDRATGKELWRKEAPRPRKEGMQKTNSPASPSPVSDGDMVVVFFGDFGMLAYGLDGEERWRLPLGPFNNANGHGSSPAMFDDLVVLICDQDTDSYLVAVDKKTGKVRYKVERPEVTRGYSTPVVYRPKTGPAELIVPGAFQLIAYNLETGAKLWWVNGMAWQLKGTAVIDGDILYVNAWEIGGDTESPPEMPSFAEIVAKYDANHDGFVSKEEAPENLKNWFRENDFNGDGKIDAREWGFWILHRQAQNSMSAIRMGGRGDVTATNVLWRYRKSLPNVPSPLLYKGVLFLVKDGGVVTTLNPKTGEVLKQARLTGAIEQYWASPVGADGKVYMVSQACKVSVLRASGDWEVLKMNDLDDECFATPAIVDGRIYLRTRTGLYAFGRGKK